MAESSESANVDINPSFGMKITLKGISAKFNDVQHISTTTLATWLNTPDQNIILLDSRPEEEFIISHLPKAVRVDPDTNNIDDIIKSLPRLIKTEEKARIVCYCSIGYRSSLLAQKLQQYYKNTQTETKPEIYNLEGSLFKWANEKRAMVDSVDQPTIYAHPYNGLWGKLLNKELRKLN
ncbi:hypothetical protein SNE40_012552 [Patella caerulea]|uniref:Rhodanese domain-containing protein n=1 Tax=Patella caerulea TaxID=87958 RepID=A0AAN8PN25_PATCE